MRDWQEIDGWVVYPDGTRLRVIAGGGGSGGGKTTVTNQIPAKTSEEIELIKKQNAILDIQIEELKRQNDALTAIFPDQQKLLSAQTEAAISFAEYQKIQTNLSIELTDRALAEIEGTPQEQEIRRLSNERALAILRGEAPPLLPGQQERIDTIFGTARAEATEELSRYGEDLAASRGMRVTDSPIGHELLRQKSLLERNLAAGKAGAELNVGQAQQVFDESVRQFQENLRQQAFQNRLALTGRTVSNTLPIFASSSTSSALTGAGNLLSNLSADRLGQASQTSRVATGAGGFNTGGAVTGAVGGAASGALVGSQIGWLGGPYGALAGAALGGAAGAFSSETLKKDILPLDQDEYDRALAKLKDVPVTRWRYKWDRDDRPLRTGPLLEMLPVELREDALRVDMVSYAGTLHAGLKAVTRRLERVEASLPVKAARKTPAGLPVRKVA